eukprot:COSAG04_NODE_1505_length_6506_cov_4.798335_4_plen_185_part_00
MSRSTQQPMPANPRHGRGGYRHILADGCCAVGGGARQGGGGAGGAGRRAPELLYEGRARRSGHAWGGAARLEPPLQRRIDRRPQTQPARSKGAVLRRADLLPRWRNGAGGGGTALGTVDVAFSQPSRRRSAPSRSISAARPLSTAAPGETTPPRRREADQPNNHEQTGLRGAPVGASRAVPCHS